MDTRFALPADTVLDGAYRIVSVVGSGGFGITYEAEDVNLATTVALKEYYPFDFGDRDRTMSVRPKSERHQKTFEWGRANFLKEARTLARFEHPAIVRVTRVFEANATAYMVMSFERGQSFEAWLKGLGRPPTQGELDAIVAPLLGALETMHAADFLHRDIAPDNIIVRADGSPVLLDFGAARRAVAEMSRSLTGIVKAGYSPHEQYSADGRLQGPWSDLYALGGTLYRAVTGSAPEESTLRFDEDRMAPAAVAARGSYRPEFLTGIDACLKVRHSERPRSVAQLRPMLLEGGAQPPRSTGKYSPETRRVSDEHAPQSARYAIPSRAEPRARRPWLAVAIALLMITGGAWGGYEFTRWQRTENDRLASDARTAEAEAKRRQDVREAERTQTAAREQAAAEDAARRRAQAEAEARRKDEARKDEERREEERRRSASRDDKAPPAPPRPDDTPRAPSGQALKLTAKLTGQPDNPQRGWLGAGLDAVDQPLSQALGLRNANGVLVLSIATASPAAQSGLRLGDVVVGLNGRPAPSANEVRQRLGAMAPGSDATLEVWRTDLDFLQTVRRLADSGNAESAYHLGRLYAAGAGVARNDAEAARWYRKAAEAGNANGEAALAVALMEGHGAAKDQPEALRLLRAAAAKNHAEAMTRLGHILVAGKIADKDPLEAARLFNKAAETGYVPAMADLGRMYAGGTGVQADPAKAAMWFKQAADQGNSAGMAGLAWLYEQGKGVEKDAAKAVMWYRRAIDLGNPTAMTDLALLLVQGKGVPKDEPGAIGLYRRAVGLGNSIAMNNLAWMLQRGIGVPRKDPDEAAELMLKALERGNDFSYRQMTQESRAWSVEFRMALQRKLRDAGFYTARIDGEFREPTVAAINAYIKRPR